MQRRRSSRWGGFSRRRGNSRALALGVMLFILAITIAPPIKHYFTQRAQISALNNQLSSNNAALVQARKELQLWRDPEYIKSQARERLHFVLPGERQYIVTDSTSTPEVGTGTKVAENMPDGQPWYLRMIASITETGAQ